jgi:hypothetical protein
MLGARRLVSVALAVLWALVLGAGTAQAAVIYGRGFSFTSPEGLSGPVGLAVDQSSGDVYVVDQGNNALKKFSVSGQTATQVWKAEMPGAIPNQATVDDYTGEYDGDVFVAGYGSGKIYRISSAGALLASPIEGLSNPTDVAVDAAGDFFVSSIGNDTVSEFNSKWEPVNAEGKKDADNTVIEGLEVPQALAVSENGQELYVATAYSGTVQYAPVGEFYMPMAILDPNPSNGVTISPAGHLLVDHGSEVDEYESSGGLLREFGSGLLSGAYGLGVYGGRTFVADSAANQVEVFENGATPEAPVAEAATAITDTSALLHGELNPHSSAKVGWYFAYNAGGGSTPVGGEIEGEAVDEHSEVRGLEPSTTYSFCLVATNGFGIEYGVPLSFTTAGFEPTIDSQSVSDVGPLSGTLDAQVDPQNQETRCLEFEYAEAATYATSRTYDHDAQCVPIELGGGHAVRSTSASISGLKPSTEYDFRVVVENPSSPVGGTHGENHTFSTLPGGIAGLPDGRVYEMVDPAENQDAAIYAPQALPGAAFYQAGGSISQYGFDSRFPFQAAAAGDAVAYVGEPTSPGEGERGNTKGDEYLATRNPDGGWKQINLEPPGYAGAHYQAFSSELSQGVLVAEANESKEIPPLTSNSPAGERLQVLYARGTDEDTYRPLFTSTPPHESEEGFGTADDGDQRIEPTRYAGASANWEELLFEANDSLTPNAINGGAHENNLYVSVAGNLSAVNILPGQADSEPDALFGAM